MPSSTPSSTVKLKNSLRGDLDNIVLKALRKEPARRYASVAHLAEDIRRHLQGLPVTAAPQSVTYRANRFVRRHKVGVAATALAALVTVGGVVAIVREAGVAAANAERAEKRFADVRQLSDTLLFEVHDEIQKLPGSIPARKLIVQRSLEYLNRLAQDSGKDISLQRELGNAYERVGLVQGNPDGPNLGDISGAEDSFRKAMSIRKRLVESGKRPDAVDLIAVAASYREMCGLNARYLNKISVALDYCNQARGIAEKLLDADPGNPSLAREMAKICEATGGVYGESSTVGNAGDYDRALENHNKALTLVTDLTKRFPENSDLQWWEGKLYILTADDLYARGSMREALPLYQNAQRTLEALEQSKRSPNFIHYLAVSYQRLGDMLLTDGHFAQSVPYYRKQVEVSERASASDPKDIATRVDLAAGRATYGHSLWRSGHPTAGIASLRQGLAELKQSGQNDGRANGVNAALLGWLAGALEKRGDLDEALQDYQLSEAAYRQSCELDPADSEDCLQMAGTEECIAQIFLRQRKPRQALTHYDAAMKATQPFLDRNKPNLEAIYTAVNLDFGMGESLRLLALNSEGSNLPPVEACNWFQKSRDVFARIPEWHPISPTEFDARSRQEIESRIEQCRPSHARSSSRSTAHAAEKGRQ